MPLSRLPALCPTTHTSLAPLALVRVWVSRHQHPTSLVAVLHAGFLLPFPSLPPSAAAPEPTDWLAAGCMCCGAATRLIEGLVEVD